MAALIWQEYKVELEQQIESDQQIMEINRIKLIKQLEGYHYPSLDYAEKYQNLLRLYPDNFSTSEFYTYLISRISRGIEITSWRWLSQDGRLFLLMTFQGSFEQIRQLMTLALGYQKTSRLESVDIKLVEGRLTADLKLAFYLKEQVYEE
ncbi:hypothetical protein [Vibrio ishigakensis]|uniref:hypothetical protein n=1 Tax=Vibrio ishigakensis TaxID=1481914 RepID=UPI0021C28234|nr:hypothetical protein [Vibrio ishigakensis]